MKFKAVKGTRDFYPPDMAIRNWIVDAWCRVSRRNGFEEYDGPVFEMLDLYRAKSGEGIVSELFHFEDRGGRELAIRPEMTPTLARMIAARAQSLPRPIKWFSVPRLCRAERPQRGRLREFFQWNVDIVGVDDVLADAECIYVAIDFFREVGLSATDMVMKINSRSLLSALLKARGFETGRHEAIFAVLDRRDKIPREAFLEMLQQITTSSEELAVLQTIGDAKGDEGLVSLANMSCGTPEAESELDRLQQVFARLKQMDVADYCVFDMGIVRGLAYYTGVVFEGFSQGSFQRAVCGGGRYDQLLTVLGGPPMSGIGFGTSDVVVQELLNDAGRLPAEARTTRHVDCFVIDADQGLLDQVLSLVAQLRRKGLAADFSYRRQSLGKQLKQAHNLGAARAVIVGRMFNDQQLLSVKNLTSGQQIDIPTDEFMNDPMHWPETSPPL